MKLLFLLIIVSLITSNLKAQSNIDESFLFKMWLFADRDINKEVLKNDSIFSTFNDITELNLDKIECKLLGSEYQFVFLTLYNIKNNNFLDNVTYKRNLSSDEVKNYFIPVNKYIGQYVLAINSKTGMSYRLSGFNGNDFLGFLSDFKEAYKLKYKKGLSDKEFLKQYHIEGIDFCCLYEGLKAKEVDRDKYSCLKRCSDPISIH
jgi:hypothetical protein